ncbi:MAG: outer membrane protein [Methylovirgula sp.]
MRWIGTAAIATSFFSLIGSALAADLPSIKGPMPYTPPPPAFTWTGCYAGLNIGYGWQRDRTYDPNLFIDAGGDTADGVVGGGQIGCDYQQGPLVFGLQGRFDGSGVSGHHYYFGGTPGDILGARTHWFATETGRIGYAIMPQTLLYIRGGIAEADIGFSDVDMTIPYWGGASTTRVGWTIGGGLEYALAPSWSVFAEYNYADFGSRNLFLNYTSPIAAFATPYSYYERNNFQTFLVGVNYRFNWFAPPAPVVAKY